MTRRIRSRTNRLRLAADIGGTFTDIAAFDERTGKLTFGKALSTPQRLVEGINAGVAKADSAYKSAGRLQPVFPQARAARRAGAAFRGEGARAFRRRNRGAPRREGDRGVRPHAGTARRGGDRDPVSQLLCQA